MSQVDRVLHDVHLVFQCRGDVHCGVGNDEWIVVSRHVHHEAVADAARRAQTRLARDDGGHQLVGMQRALHQCLRFSLTHEGDGRVGGRMAMRHVDDGHA